MRAPRPCDAPAPRSDPEARRDRMLPGRVDQISVFGHRALLARLDHDAQPAGSLAPPPASRQRAQRPTDREAVEVVTAVRRHWPSVALDSPRAGNPALAVAFREVLAINVATIAAAERSVAISTFSQVPPFDA